MKIKSLISLILILVFGCNKKDPDPTFLNTQWYLSSIQNTKAKQIINYPDSILVKESITFTDSLTMMFHGACNGGKAKYTVQNDSINISDLVTTQILCSYYQWEEYLGNNLDSAFRFIISNKQLEIFSKGTYNLIFSH